ncbi:unnamed protein product, partial [Mesorhabditis spiculigera]
MKPMTKLILLFLIISTLSDFAMSNSDGTPEIQKSDADPNLKEPEEKPEGWNVVSQSPPRPCWRNTDKPIPPEELEKAENGNNNQNKSF